MGVYVLERGYFAAVAIEVFVSRVTLHLVRSSTLGHMSDHLDGFIGIYS